MAESALPCCVDKRANLRQQFCLRDSSHKLIPRKLNFWAQIPSSHATEELFAKIRSNESAHKSTQSAHNTPATSLGSHGSISGEGANFTGHRVLIRRELPLRSS